MHSPAEAHKNLGEQGFDAYRVLSSYIGEKRPFTLGVRVVAGSNPAAPTNRKSSVFS